MNKKFNCRKIKTGMVAIKRSFICAVFIFLLAFGENVRKRCGGKRD